MVKDEDVCLHCGLCAERCPTGAWDMQKFLLDMTHAGETPQARRPQRESRRRRGRWRRTDDRWQPIARINDFVVKFANVNGSGSASANGLFAQGDPAHGRAGRRAQHLPVEHPGPADVVRGAHRRGAAGAAAAAASTSMVAMNPETWDEDVAEIEPGGYLFYDSTQAAAAVEASATTSPCSACR